MGLFLFLLVAGVLIFVHELGHFLVARLVGVKVYEFMIGFGPKLLGFSKNGTDYSLRLLPLGGGVRLAGLSREYDEKKGFPHDSPLSLQNKRYWQRVAVVVAGPLSNLLFGAIVFFLLLTVVPTSSSVLEVVEDSPAFESGLQVGDKILAVQTTSGEEIEPNEFLKDRTIDEPVILQVRRNAETVQLSLEPAEKDNERYLGMAVSISEPIPVGLAAKASLGSAGDILKAIGTTFLDGVTGKSEMELSGPVGIAAALGNKMMWELDHLLFFVAILSLNLTFFNLLPIPMLDGGQILIFTFEALTRRRLTHGQQVFAQVASMTFLLLVMVVATYNDITSLLAR